MFQKIVLKQLSLKKKAAEDIKSMKNFTAFKMLRNENILGPELDDDNEGSDRSQEDLVVIDRSHNNLKGITSRQPPS